MEYQTYTPSAELDQLIKCFWTLKAPRSEKPGKQRIVPDGCMEMIFQLGDPYRQYSENNTSIIQPRSFVFGQITKPLYVEPTGLSSIFAVRFYPHGFLPFTSVPLQNMQDRAVALKELFGEPASSLEKKIKEAPTHDRRIEICQSFLVDRMTRPRIMDGIIRDCVRQIMELKGDLTVSELSQKTRINRRKLERRFALLVGVSPKQLAKMVRLQATLKMLVNQQCTNLTALAYQGSYYDQAHFIKDFKEFTGETPKNFYSENLKMSSLFHGES